MTNRKVFVEPQLHAEATVANGTLNYMVSGSMGTSGTSGSSGSSGSWGSNSSSVTS